MRRAWSLLLVLFLSSHGSAVATARSTVIADGRGAAGLTAYRGYLVWSKRDTTTGRWGLRLWHAGQVTSLPVASRAVAFDADAGPDEEGHPTLVYSACTSDPRAGSDLSWLKAKGCHIEQLRLDVADTPHVVASTGPAGESDTTPSRWRTGLAFARHTDGTFSSRLLLLQDGASSATPLRGPPVRCDVDCDDRRILTTVERLDLGAQVAAAVWRQDGGDVIGIGPEWFLRVNPVDGSKTFTLDDGFIDGACGFRYPLAPAAVGLGAVWVASGAECDATASAFAWRNVATKRTRIAHDQTGIVFDAARAGSTLYALRANRRAGSAAFPGPLACSRPKMHCRIVRSERPGWRSLRRHETLGPFPEA